MQIFSTKFKHVICKLTLFLLFVQENRDVVDRKDQQKFLESIDFLAQYGIPSLVSDMELATKEALKG